MALAAGVQHHDELPPERLIYLVESALTAEVVGDHRQSTRVAAELTEQAERIGLMLPLPERHRLSDLLTRLRARGANSPVA